MKAFPTPEVTENWFRPALRVLRTCVPAAAFVASFYTITSQITAQESWSPFENREETYTVGPRQKRAPAPLSPKNGAQDSEPNQNWGQYGDPPPIAPSNMGIERSELAPLGPSGEAATPNNTMQNLPTAPPPGPTRSWQSRPAPPEIASGTTSARSQSSTPPLDEKLLATLLAARHVPNRSPTLTGLWYRQLDSGKFAESGNDNELASRAEALWRSGFPAKAASLLKNVPIERSPLIAALHAKFDIGLGRTESGCAALKVANEGRKELPPAIAGDLVVQAGYCSIMNGDHKTAGTLADLAREQGLGDPDTVSILATATTGQTPNLKLLRKLTPLGLQLIQLNKIRIGLEVAQIADPPTLSIVSLESNTSDYEVLPAIEQAARLNLIPLGRLANAYRRAASSKDIPASTPSAKQTQRYTLFAAAEAERSPLQKTRHIRSFLDDARRDHLYLQALMMAAPLVESVRPAQEIGWFYETAIEILTAAGNYQAARQWATYAGLASQRGEAEYAHWLALIDLTDPAIKPHRGQELQSVEALALQGRFNTDTLHRIATVLDALDYSVPMRLWEAASRSPQPSSGHLPETGVLKLLQDAARQRNTQQTSLLAIQALGPGGGENAHLIALGDTIRALRRTGLDADARRLAFETLIAAWPHTPHR